MSADAVERHAAMSLAAGLVLDAVGTEGLSATAGVLVGMSLDETRQLVAALVTMTAAMLEKEAEAWDDDTPGELPPAMGVAAVWRMADQL